MKRLTTGSVNTLSFVKHPSWVINDFTIVLKKVVGTSTLTLNNLQDLNNLNSCKDFVRLNIDLLSNTIEGGEYFVDILNGPTSSSYLANVKEYTETQTGSGVYLDTVVFTDL